MDTEEIVIVDGQGTEHVFPAGFDPMKAAAIVRQQSAPMPAEATAGMLPPSTTSETPQPFVPPTPFPKPVEDFIEGAGRNLVSHAVGTGDLLRRGWNALVPGVLEVDRPATDPFVQQMGTAPDSFAGQAGAWTETAAELRPLLQAVASKVPGVISATKKGVATAVDRGIARPLGLSKSHAGELLDSARTAARDIAVTDRGGGVREAGARALELNKAKMRLPQAPREVINRMSGTTPATGSLNYREAEDLVTSLTQLSVNQRNALTPTMLRQVQKLSVALRNEIANAAAGVGKGEQYRAGVREYARAKQAEELLAKLAKAGLAAAGGTAAYKLVAD